MGPSEYMQSESTKVLFSNQPYVTLATDWVVDHPDMASCYHRLTFCRKYSL